ncbi:alpha/beta hydrolase [Aquisalimonas sp.]|uniref:alpha/beta fold hydrolase n=1 Tax=Aquisalimonas sp. TaxID=1872621 RepID=UPI0025C6E668|nr:alpha/beta hydrolase [Aquisalimonas sp.]
MPTININGNDIYYEDQGPKDAPALVLSHSLFFDHRMFVNQAKAFPPQNLRVVCYDHRDQGRSGRSAESPVSMDSLADDAVDLIDALDLSPCYFAGSSMGGFIALRLAARRPDLLRGCIVMASSAEPEYSFDELHPLVEGIRAEGTAAYIDQLMYIMFGDDTLANPGMAEVREFWKSHMLSLEPDIARTADGVIRRQGVLDELQDCTVPLLLLPGAQDHAYPPQLSENILDVVENGEMVTIAGAGQSLALEQPAKVNSHILEFINNT